MADRKLELERKKAKLNALREDKERKKRELLQRGKGDEGSETSLPSLGSSSIDVDEYLKSIGIQPQSEETIFTDEERSLSSIPDQKSSHVKVSKAEEFQRRVERLTVSQVTQTNIPAHETVSYTKETQTAQSGPDHRDSYYDLWLKPRKAHAFDYYDEYNLNPGLEWDDEFAVLTFDDMQDEESLSLDHQHHSKLPPGILRHGMPEVMEVAPALTEAEKGKRHEEERRETLIELSQEEKDVILMTPEFQRFFERASRVMERALSEQSADIFVDYAKSSDAEDERDKSGTRLSLNRVFFDDKWSKNRCITSMDWSPQYPELLAASYSSNNDSPHEPDGVCLIWNTKFPHKKTPEFVFHCQSPVTSTTFAKFHPNLILGGTYSGSVVLWDNRSDKKSPVQRSPLSTSAHTHPVYCLKVVGTQNSHNVISISTDGKLCSWSLDMLTQPQETLDLNHKQSKPVAATCLTFPQGSGGVNNFFVGSEEGTVYSGCRHGTSTGILEAFEGHHAPVTGIDSHSCLGPVDFSNLYLTSSFDWTLKLWSIKENKPIYSFDGNGDYIYDVAWSPIHPAVFASVDGGGRLDLWNLNYDTELPSASVVVDDHVALNCVSWTQSGLHVVAGDDLGKIWVYDVGEQLGNPRQDEWQKFSKTLDELKCNQSADDMDHQPSSLNSRG